MNLHADEFVIDDELVAELVRTQAPQWSSQPLRRLDTCGTVNVVYRLGDDKVVRLPRSAELAAGPEREARWMPIFSAGLPVRVPGHLLLGLPAERYPAHWRRSAARRHRPIGRRRSVGVLSRSRTLDRTSDLDAQRPPGRQPHHPQR